MNKSLKLMPNLIELCRKEETKLKEKYGSKYRSPIERMADEIVEDGRWLLDHIENEVWSNLPIMKARIE